MSSPTFNSNAIFDSQDFDGTFYNEFVVRPVGGIKNIYKNDHFNGEVGMRTNTVGRADLPWTGRGYIRRNTYYDLESALGAINVLIRDLTLADLVDSCGNTYTNAQIQNWDYVGEEGRPRVTADGVVCEIVVSGVIKDA